MVLLFSFFFCSGGFLVAHGEEPLPFFGEVSDGTYFITDEGYIVVDEVPPASVLEEYGAHHLFRGTLSSGTHKLRFRLPLVIPSGKTVKVFLFIGSVQGSSSLSSTFSFSINDGLDSKYSKLPTLDRNLANINLYTRQFYKDTSGTYVDESLKINGNWLSYSFVPKTDFESLSSVNLHFSTSYSGTHYFSAYIVVGSGSELVQESEAIQDKIESQYDTSQGSDVGSSAQDFADQASESLGVVSYVDTLFSSLSGLVTAGSTTLTFPALAFAVEGTEYQFWEEYTFDLAQLDGWFAGLMAAVRLATSTVVVGAVIHYLQSVYKDVIG